MKIAFIGLGSMGLPVAQRLAATDGIELALFDVQPGRLDEAAGLGRRAESVTDVVNSTDAIFTVLPADRHVESVCSEIADAGRAGQVYVDFSTIGPATIDRVDARLAGKGMPVVSVAITRGTAAARAGELALFVGSNVDLPPMLGVAFDAVASEIRLVSGLGAAKALKIANNMVVSCLNVAIGEALIVGSRLGIPADAVTTHLLSEGADSWVLRNQVIKHVLPDDLGPGYFSTFNMAKDVRLYVDLATEHGVPAFLAGVASACYRGVVANGWGDHYHPIVVKWLQQGANCPTISRTDDASSSQTLGDDAPRRLATISRGVAAVQTLASMDALGVLKRTGIDPLDAAAHLESGSAGNDALQRTAEYLTGDIGLFPVTTVLDDLTDIVGLAAAADVPGLMFEVARHRALALREGEMPPASDG